MTVMTARRAGWSMAGALLIVPAIAMQFTSEVNWGPLDFAAAALILGAMGFGVEGAARLKGPSRLAVATASVAASFLVWAELAVGLVGPG